MLDERRRVGGEDVHGVMVAGGPGTRRLLRMPSRPVAYPSPEAPPADPVHVPKRSDPARRRSKVHVVPPLTGAETVPANPAGALKPPLPSPSYSDEPARGLM